jgi:hypothetical protein
LFTSFIFRRTLIIERGNFEDAFTDLSRARKLPECSAEVEEMIKNVNKMKRMVGNLDSDLLFKNQHNTSFDMLLNKKKKSLETHSSHSGGIMHEG